MLLDKGLSDTQHKEIKQILAQQIEENIGMPMIYTLCEAIREYLVENNRTGQVRVLLLAGVGLTELTLAMIIAG